MSDHQFDAYCMICGLHPSECRCVPLGYGKVEAMTAPTAPGTQPTLEPGGAIRLKFAQPEMVSGRDDVGPYTRPTGRWVPAADECVYVWLPDGTYRNGRRVEPSGDDVERVARAIYESMFVGDDYECLPEIEKHSNRQAAIAAIAAMNRPDVEALQRRVEQRDAAYLRLAASYNWEHERAEAAEARNRELVRERDEARSHARLLLPMAKGWAAEHPVGANQVIVDEAAKELEIRA